MQSSSNIRIITAHLKKDPVMYVSASAAFISAIFVPPSAEYLEYLDLRVISLLLSLMLVVAGMKKAGVFDLLTQRLLILAHNTRTIAAVLVGICFFSSMLITNDVALITFVPFGVAILEKAQKRKLLIPVIVLQTVAANLGSMLTPLGNPQNLYIYSISNMTVTQFLSVMAVPTGISLLLLIIAVMLIRPEHVEPSGECSAGCNKFAVILPWLILFVFCLTAVLHVISYIAVLAAVLAWIIVFDRKLLFCADYGLLLTFIFLFIFIGNIKSIPVVSSTLLALVGGREITAGILLSQVISNVPAAMLMSKFTSNYSALLVGVNLGGLGTLIASMASVISYKLYSVTPDAQTGRYMIVFTAVNLLFLGVLWAVVIIIT